MPQTRIDKAFGLDFPDHKRADFGNDGEGKEDCLQIIGAGLPRCGTTSLKAALEILGFGPCHHMIVIASSLFSLLFLFFFFFSIDCLFYMLGVGAAQAIGGQGRASEPGSNLIVARVVVVV